ncbi:MAG: hypothetical protein AAF092_09200 [Pseudomonadota bacterium]
MRWALPLVCVALAGCEAPPVQDGVPIFEPDYGSVETRLLDDDLVQFVVSMRGARGNWDLRDFADCAAAQYTLIRGFSFAQHVRTNVIENAGLWEADAVYTISPDLPPGVKTLDAEVTLAACEEAGIPAI